MSQPSTTPSNDNPTEDLHTLLLSIQRDPKSAAAALPTLSNAELLRLFALFTEPEDEKGKDTVELRASAYLALSSFVNTVRDDEQSGDQEQRQKATQQLASAFYPTIEDVLRGSNTVHIGATLSFLSALFQVDSTSASLIFGREGNLECIADVVELASAMNPTTLKLREAKVRLELALVTLLSNAMGHADCRKLINGSTTASEGSRVTTWLQQVAEQSKDSRVQASAALALVKLIQGRIQDTESAQSGIPADVVPQDGISSTDELAKLLQRIVISSTPNPSSSSTKASSLHPKVLREAVEGLAYLSVHPSIRDYIAFQPTLLKSLFTAGLQSTKKIKPSSSLSSSRIPEKEGEVSTLSGDHRMHLSLHYGLALILANLCQYRPRLSKEEEQIAKLRRMTKPPTEDGQQQQHSAGRMGSQEESEDSRTSNVAVRARIKALCAAGMLPLLAGLARSESPSARECTSRIYLSVVEDQANRGEVLKNGGGRALLDLIKSYSSKGPKEPALVVPDWIAIQALSKLAITASPFQVFGPDIGATQDAIVPFCSVLTFADSLSSTPLRQSSAGENQLPTSLQRFEALMALTNIATLGPEMAERIVKMNGIWNAVESGLLEEHEMLRRANVELVCNLVVCEAGFDKFVPVGGGGGGGGGSVESRLQILVALADVEDLGTRKAASGALAMLSSDERVCVGLVGLQRKRGSLVRILRGLLIEEREEGETQGGDRSDSIADLDLVHRGIVILRNLAVLFVEKRKEGTKGFVEALAEEGVVGVVERVVSDGMRRQKQGGSDIVRAILENALEFVVALRNVVE